jgi:outer membrane protein
MAQDGKTRYTLTDCVQAGLQRNTDLQRSRNDIDKAVSSKTAAFGDFLPSVSVDGSWTRADRAQYGFQSSRGIYQSRDFFSYNAGVNLTLFDGLSNIRNADRSILGLQSAERSTEKREQDVVFTVQQSFFNALRLQQLVTVHSANLERSRKQLDRIKEFHAVGAVPLADVYRQQVQVGRDELTLLQAENDHRNALINIQVLLALDPRQPFEIDPAGVGNTIDSLEVAQYRAALPSVDALITNALQARPDLKQAQLNLDIAGKSVQIAAAGHYPVVSAFARYGWSNNRIAELWSNDLGSFNYGLNFTVPIFSNFKVLTSQQKATIEERNSESVLTDLQRSIGAEIKKADNNLAAAEKTVEIARRTLFSAQEDQRIANERYSLGAGTLLDLIVANSNLTAAQSEVVNSTFNYHIARKQLENALGAMSY